MVASAAAAGSPAIHPSRVLAAVAGVAPIVATVGGGLDWPMIGHEPPTAATNPSSTGSAPKRGPPCAEVGRHDRGRRLGDSGGRGRSRLLRRLRRHALEARRRDRPTIWSHSCRTTRGSRATSRARARRWPATRSSASWATRRAARTCWGSTRRPARCAGRPRSTPTGSGHDRLAGLVGDTIFTGISANGAGGPTSTFRGAIVALDAQTGQILWRSYSLPDNGGVPGATPARRCSRRPQSTFRSASSTARSARRTGSRRASTRATRRPPASTSRARSRAPLEVHRRVRPGDRRAAVVVPRVRPRALGARLRQPAASGQVLRAETDGENWDLGGSGRQCLAGEGSTAAGATSSASARRAASTRPRREDRSVHLEHARRPRRRPGRDELGHGLRRRPHLRLDHEPAQRPLQADAARSDLGPVRHGRLLGGARPGDRDDPVADRRSAVELPAWGCWRVGPRPRLVRERRRLRVLDGAAREPDQMFALDGETGAILWRFAAGSSVAPARPLWTAPSTGAPATPRLGGNGNNRLYAFSIDGVRNSRAADIQGHE